MSGIRLRIGMARFRDFVQPAQCGVHVRFASRRFKQREAQTIGRFHMPALCRRRIPTEPFVAIGRRPPAAHIAFAEAKPGLGIAAARRLQ